MISGLLLWAATWLINNDRGWKTPAAAFVLAAATNWKFQSFPTAGLAFLAILLLKKEVRGALLYLGLLAAWYLSPALFKPWSFILEIYSVWATKLGEFLPGGWLSFQHIFILPIKAFGLPLDYGTAQLISVLCGLALAAALTIWIFREKRVREDTEILTEALAVSFGWGSLFALLFSPMAQSAAFIQYALLLMPCLRRDWRAFAPIAAAWFLISLVYSDLVPKALRLLLTDYGVKPWGVLILGGLVAYRLYQSRLAPGPTQEMVIRNSGPS